MVHGGTGARSGAAAQGVDPATTVKCPRCGGRVRELGAPAKNPSSGKEPEPHPHHRQGEEGGAGGTCSERALMKAPIYDFDNVLCSLHANAYIEDLSGVRSPPERARGREEEAGGLQGQKQIPVY